MSVSVVTQPIDGATRREINMKALYLSAALALVLAAPAFGQQGGGTAAGGQGAPQAQQGAQDQQSAPAAPTRRRQAPQQQGAGTTDQQQLQGTNQQMDAPQGTPLGARPQSRQPQAPQQPQMSAPSVGPQGTAVPGASTNQGGNQGGADTTTQQSAPQGAMGAAAMAAAQGPCQLLFYPNGNAPDAQGLPPNFVGQTAPRRMFASMGNCQNTTIETIQ